MFKSIPPDENIAPNTGENIKDGGMQNVDLKRYNRLECPITLQPNNATFDDIAIHALLRQRLSQGTIEKHLRYARFMESHPCPVDFRNPTIENFVRHLDYREQIEKATPNALKHEWKAMQMFLKAYGIPTWDIKLPTPQKSHKRILPFPDTVHRFFYHTYSDDTYENTLYQYLFYHSFLIGWRTPSEICELTVDDVIINSDGTGCITITETKKQKTKRTVLPRKQILSSRTNKSFKNYLDHWRPKIENQHSKDAFYLQPNGKPFTVRHLGHKLSKYGKQIWPYFHPYDMRHWCAIARLIETKIKTGNYDVYQVRNWLGHEKIETTMNYLRYAEQYYKQAPYDWIQRVLKFYNNNVIEKENPLKPTKPQKTFVSSGNSPREQYGPEDTCIAFSKEIWSRKTDFWGVLDFQPLTNLFYFLNIKSQEYMGVGM